LLLDDLEVQYVCAAALTCRVGCCDLKRELAGIEPSAGGDAAFEADAVGPVRPVTRSSPAALLRVHRVPRVFRALGFAQRPWMARPGVWRTKVSVTVAVSSSTNENVVPI